MPVFCIFPWIQVGQAEFLSLCSIKVSENSESRYYLCILCVLWGHSCEMVPRLQKLKFWYYSFCAGSWNRSSCHEWVIWFKVRGLWASAVLLAVSSWHWKWAGSHAWGWAEPPHVQDKDTAHCQKRTGKGRIAALCVCQCRQPGESQEAAPQLQYLTGLPEWGACADLPHPAGTGATVSMTSLSWVGTEGEERMLKCACLGCSKCSVLHRHIYSYSHP